MQFGIVPIKTLGLNKVLWHHFWSPSCHCNRSPSFIKNLEGGCCSFIFYRHGNVQDPKYHILIEPAVDNMPSEDEVDDATRVNKIIENQLRIAPTQYMWFHRRFKTRPEGYEEIY